MSIVLTEGQKRGLEIAVKRYRDGEKYTCILGYAGVGKSTLVKFIIKALGLTDEQVAYTSYTGRAAMILAQMGNPNAKTLHKLLYDAYLTKEGRYILRPKKHLPSNLKLIVVDEISMPPLKIIQLLASHGIHVLCLGDNFQLPPPLGQDNGITQNPHIVLTEIMRQAQESEIIRLSMDIRNGRSLQKFKGKEVQIIDKEDLVDGMYGWADQIICATNKTRRMINNFCRQQRGFGSEPQDGDKIICLSNYWDDVAEDGTTLVNGLTGTLGNPTVRFNSATKKRDIVAGFSPDFKGIYQGDNSFYDLRIDPGIFKTGEPTISLAQKAVLMKDKEKFFMVPREFDYGYCISCHKSQGGQYDKVLLFEENFPFSREEHQRWLYTGITRAISRLVIVRK